MVQLLGAPATNSGRPCGVPTTWASVPPEPREGVERRPQPSGMPQGSPSLRSCRGGGELWARPSGQPASCSLRRRPGAAVKGEGGRACHPARPPSRGTALCCSETARRNGLPSTDRPASCLSRRRLWERGHRAQETISRLPAPPRGPEEGACPRSVSRCLRVKSDGWFPPSQGSMGPSAGPETGQPWKSPARGGQRLAPCTRRRNKSNSAKVRSGAGRRRVCPALPSSTQHQMGGLGQGDTPA